MAQRSLPPIPDDGVKCFSSNHGPNIVLRNNRRTALWLHNRHGGKVYVSRPLRKRDKISIDMRSGRVYLGLGHCKPREQDIRNATDPLKFDGMFITCNILSCRASAHFHRVSSRSVMLRTSFHETSKSYELEVPKDDVYVLLEVCSKHVMVEICSDNSDFTFDAMCGPDINFPRHPRRFASLRPNHSESLCCIQQPLSNGEQLTMNIQPVGCPFGTCVKVYLSHSDVKTTFLRSITTAPYLKFEAVGTYSVSLASDGHVTYTTINGQTKTKPFPELAGNEPTYVYVKLFGLLVNISSELQDPPDIPSGNNSQFIEDTPLNTDQDEVDGVLPDPTGKVHEPRYDFPAMIRRHFTELLNRLEPDPLSDFLFQYNFLSLKEESEYLEWDRSRRCRKVLEVLMEKPSTKDTFIKAMKYPGFPQEHILGILGLN